MSIITNKLDSAVVDALWHIYRRPDPPTTCSGDGNLPWNDPVFSERMLREHLDESHGAASRTTAERALQLDWLDNALNLPPKDDRILDITCGPGLYAVALAERGHLVTGVDFGPAAIEYANSLAKMHGVAERCTFIEQDVREYTPETAAYDAALFLYGQLAVFRRDEAAALLRQIAGALRPGGRLVVELLDQDQVDKENSKWWFTDETRLWGDRPFLHLGERTWNAEHSMSIERFYTIDLETGDLQTVELCDQTYAVAEMKQMLREAGFAEVTAYPAWDSVALYDAAEWVVYVAETAR